jgi:hypothetical protein
VVGFWEGHGFSRVVSWEMLSGFTAEDFWQLAAES